MATITKKTGLSRAERREAHKQGTWTPPPHADRRDREGTREIRFRPYSAKDPAAWQHTHGVKQARRVRKTTGKGFEWQFITAGELVARHGSSKHHAA